mmetsp:Transcript_4960/g.10432  ORF Transcript_4960/g.10432 Transcript_4960/m.10432 type:complete len:327 (+) Transcript_4960:856-1836(+)
MNAETILEASPPAPAMLLSTTPASLLLTTSQLATRSLAMATRGPDAKPLPLSKPLTYLVRTESSLLSSVKATALSVALAAFFNPLAQILLKSATHRHAALWITALNTAKSESLSSSQAAPSPLSSRASVQSSTRWSLMLTIEALSPASASFSSSTPATSPVVRSSLASSAILSSSESWRAATFQPRMARLTSMASLTTTLLSARVMLASLAWATLFSAHSFMAVTKVSTSTSEAMRGETSTLLERILSWVRARPSANSASASISPFFFFFPVESLRAASSLTLATSRSTIFWTWLLASTTREWLPPAMCVRLMAHWVSTLSSVLLV